MPARRHPIMHVAAAMVSLAYAGASGPAHAADYAGTWAADLANCKTPQDSTEAPLVLSSKGYDQHEAHCTFSGLKPSGAGEWDGKAACSVEGDSQSFDVKLTVSGDTLTLTEDGASRDLLRCP
ncbi:MAG: hypothetical protein ACXWVS_03400 [Hyphomicrobium sp.]